jgi:hypothetical protein
MSVPYGMRLLEPFRASGHGFASMPPSDGDRADRQQMSRDGRGQRDRMTVTPFVNVALHRISPHCMACKPGSEVTGPLLSQNLRTLLKSYATLTVCGHVIG